MVLCPLFNMMVVGKDGPRRKELKTGDLVMQMALPMKRQKRCRLGKFINANLFQ